MQIGFGAAIAAGGRGIRPFRGDIALVKVLWSEKRLAVRPLVRRKTLGPASKKAGAVPVAEREDSPCQAAVAGCAPVAAASSKRGDALVVEGGDLFCRSRQLCPGL